ncbi:MAG: cytochrome c biogenesis protein CcsA [Proteobacteria bacterium]|nr:cytochrome c biogenesis protein CcsA [Pseudomonadota bacterium]
MSIIQLLLSVAAAAIYLMQLHNVQGNRFVFIAAIFHFLALAQIVTQGFVTENPLMPSAWGSTLSLLIFLAVLACWQLLVLPAMRVVVLGGTAFAATLPLWLPASAPLVFSLHGALALIVYALALAAFLLCLDLSLSEQRLRAQPPSNNALPLLVREQRYFNYVLLSFAVLTLTLASGIYTAISSNTPVFELTHKKIFACLTWLVFLLLLLGRYFAGWRGRVAQRWFFSGYVFLLLSYAGSTVVREIILEKTG